MRRFCTYLWTVNGAGWFVLGILAESPEAILVSVVCVGVAAFCYARFD